MKIRLSIVLATALSMIGATALHASDPFAVTPALHARAAFGCTGVTMSGGVVNSAVISTNTAGTSGHVVSNGNVSVTGGTINGNVTAGPGKTINTSGSGTITGTRSNATVAESCTPIDLTSLASTLPASNNNGQIPLTAQGKNALAGSSHTELNVGGGDTLTLPAGTYYFTKFTLSGGAKLVLTGTTNIFCTGSVTLSGGSLTTNQPYQLRFFVSGTGAVNVSSSTFNGFLYAPSAAATLSAGTLKGALFANQVTISGNAHLTRAVDDLLPRVTITSPSNGAPVSDPAHVIVTGTAADDETPVTVRVNGAAATVAADGTFQITIDLTGASSPATITAVATDGAGNTRSASITVTTTTTVTPPSISLTTPPPGSFVKTRLVNLAGSAGTATSVTVNGSSATIVNGVWSLSGFDLGPDGAHTLTITGTNAGGPSTITPTITSDTVAPAVVSSVTPAPSIDGWNNGPVSVSFICSDTGSGIATCSDPVTLSASGGNQSVTGQAVDRAGNVASTTVVVNIDPVPPEITSVVFPPAVTRAATATVTAHVADALSGIRTVRCNGQPATLSGGTLTCTVTLDAGTNNIEITADDHAANTTSVQSTTLRDSLPPLVTVTSPASPASTNAASIEIAGTAIDDQGVTALTVNGVAATLAESTFTAVVPLAEGANTIPIVASDAAGNSATASVTVFRNSVPSVSITSPADLTVVSNAIINVTGTVSGTTSQVMVNGTAATLSGSTFTASVPLQQGRTAITAVAASGAGVGGSATINVYRDSIPPRLLVYTPFDYDSVPIGEVTVTGMVDDIVQGTVNAGQVRVDINGVPATVANRGFEARVPLQLGRNDLTITATDQAGNQTSTTIRQYYDNTPRQRLVAVSGDRQHGLIGTMLAQPVVVRFEQPGGQPIAGAALTFTVIGNNATLSAGSASGRSLKVVTDALGQATVRWTLGTHAGAASHRVEVRADGIWEPLQLTAIGDVAPPSLIVVDSGNAQMGATEAELARPLVAVVVDRGSNRVEGVPVEFAVADGGGSFGGQPTITVITDSDGRAIAKPVLGTQEGNDNNVFTATVNGASESVGSVTFVASGRVAGPAGNTQINGVILDNSNLPIEGVSVRVDGTTLVTQTDAQGRFVIAQAPVGYVKLFIDGSTTHRDGTWPTLEFIMYTVSGANNDLGMPIYLLPIDLRRGILVDDTTGGTLTIPELPGFSLTIAPGSATFPGGGRTGTVSATLVHADKVPMAPGFGQQPKFIVTVQPPGVHFDPPAAVSYPNVDGLAPGEMTEFYSFDHDLGQFIVIGTGTTSEDGSIVRSDPGVGLIKGGWQSQGNPAPIATTSKCGDCKKSAGSGCVIDPAKNLFPCTDDKNVCTFDYCVGGVCKHQLGKVVLDSVTSPTRHFHIDTVPTMPDLIAKIKMTGVIPDVTDRVRLKWKVALHWQAPNGRNVNYESQERDAPATYTHDWTTPMTVGTSSFYGGAITITATLIRGLDRHECYRLTINAQTIVGDQPTMAQVDAAIGNDSTLHHLICQESSWRQFIASGMPYTSGSPMGVGLTQQTDAPTDSDFWSWQANVAHGVTEYNRKQAEARAGVVNARTHFGDPTIPDFDATQLQAETLRRYNGGRYYAWDAANRQWVHDPSLTHGGDPDYVNHVLNCTP